MSSYLGNFNGQKITGTSKALVSTSGGAFDSLTLTNIHGSNAATVDLYYANTSGNDITDTGTNSNEAANAATTSSVTLTVDGTTATADTFQDEKVFKSDGTLFGTAAFSSGTELIFSGGLSQTLANNADLFTGTRYYILKTFSIPVASTLVLESSDINFDATEYALYIKLGAGTIDLTRRQ
tara:strand:+ start:427 stop:969 length:543 start_codon:yes stop_codon:yes gene_type:complete